MTATFPLGGIVCGRTITMSHSMTVTLRGGLACVTLVSLLFVSSITLPREFLLGQSQAAAAPTICSGSSMACPTVVSRRVCIHVGVRIDEVPNQDVKCQPRGRHAPGDIPAAAMREPRTGSLPCDLRVVVEWQEERSQLAQENIHLVATF